MAAPAFVLVEPRLPENVGAAARALANFGFGDLRLVAPEVAPDDPRAVAAATHGAAVLAGARVYADLATALGDRTAVWATTALGRDVASPPAAPRPAAARWAAERAPAVVFGPERTGLRAEHLARVDTLVTIPTVAPARALNLAQAVLLLAWEARCALDAEAAGDGAGDRPPKAERAAVDALVERLLRAGEARGYWSDPARRERAQASVRGALQRAGFTAAEDGALAGLFAALERPPTSRG